jgi:branched-chain amino acid transport system substrate-binding protein
MKGDIDFRTLACWPPPPWPGAGRRCRRRAAVRPGQGAVLPVLVYRTGAYAPNGTPWANGYVDYLKLVNAARRHQRREDRPSKSARPATPPTGRGVLRAPEGQGRPSCSSRCPPASPSPDRQGPGRQDPADHRWATAAANRRRPVFKWNFPLLGTYWWRRRHPDPAHRQEGRRDKLKGKKIALVYHDSPTARSRSRCCRSAPRCTASTCSCCR